jgi:hypothetical protein
VLTDASLTTVLLPNARTHTHTHPLTHTHRLPCPHGPHAQPWCGNDGSEACMDLINLTEFWIGRRDEVRLNRLCNTPCTLVTCEVQVIVSRCTHPPTHFHWPTSTHFHWPTPARPPTQPTASTGLLPPTHALTHPLPLAYFHFHTCTRRQGSTATDGIHWGLMAIDDSESTHMWTSSTWAGTTPGNPMTFQAQKAMLENCNFVKSNVSA